MFGKFSIFNRPVKHVHNWELVAVNDDYYTKYTDTGNKKNWQMRFYSCGCGNRKFETDYNSSYYPHQGINQARQNWLDVAVVPDNSYHPTTSSGFVSVDTIKPDSLDPVLEYQKTLKEIANTLGVVLNRDFSLEAKYPTLKKAAERYHKELDKCRTLDSLKDDPDE